VGYGLAVIFRKKNKGVKSDQLEILLGCYNYLLAKIKVGMHVNDRRGHFIRMNLVFQVNLSYPAFIPGG